jgi:hypothetical protein
MGGGRERAGRETERGGGEEGSGRGGRERKREGARTSERETREGHVGSGKGEWSKGSHGKRFRV